MRYGPSVLDEVRDRISISSIVGHRVIWDKKKTRAAKGDYWACCPFHGEKTPSFHVDDRKGIYHCFGCGVTGDHFKFLMELEGRDFPEAVQIVAEQAGVQLPQDTPEAREKAAKRLGVIEANDRACTWFQGRLQANAGALDYLRARGVTAEEITKFKLGFAPDGNALMATQMAAPGDMVAAGLLGETDGRTYDWFRNRITFPILDGKGHALGFSARALGDGEPKYLNSPTTAAFDKGATLYNGASAKAAAWDGKALVVVEGNVDVIASERAGYAAAAPMGTALTEQHVALVAKAAEAPVFCFDGDAAGRKAINRAIDLLLPAVSPAFAPRFASLPDGMDPDSMVRRGVSQFAQSIEGSISIDDALWRRETVGISPGVPEQRAKLEGKLRELLGKIADRDTRRAFGEDFKDRLRSLSGRLGVYRSNSYSNHSTSPVSNRLLAGYSKGVGLSLREAILVGAIAAAPHAAMDRVEDLSADSRMSPEAVSLINNLIGAMMQAPDTAMTEILQATGLTDVVEDAVSKANAAGVALHIGPEDSAEAAQFIAGIKRH